MARIYRRVQLDHPAIVAVKPAEQDERIFLVRTADISASGAMFCSERHFTSGTRVKVALILNEGHSQSNKLKVMFTGRIVRCEPGRFAVAFDAVCPIPLSPEGATFKTGG